MEKNINSNCFISSQKLLSKSSEFNMKEFIINNFLKLRLENDKTIIYVNNKRFNQCKYLLLDIPIEETTSLEDIESIDDIAHRLDRSLETESERRRTKPTEVEFWGHCSNIQVWYENNYNTKLLFKNLAFPLLKKLSEVGDKLAEKVFKEEIAIRFSEGNQTVKEYLKEEGYLGYLDIAQFYNLLYDIKFNSFNELLSTIGTFFIIDRKSISEFSEFIETLDDNRLKELVIDSNEAHQLNFYLALVDYLGEYREGSSESQMIRNVFKRIGARSFDSLIKLVIDNNGYIDISVLETLIYIDNGRMRDFLINNKYKLNFDSEYVLRDFQYILNVLLRCFKPKELMKFLEENHKDDLYKIILPKILGFRFLKMSDRKDLELKQFITAFLLEEAGVNDYRENLEKLGDFLADTFLSELIDRYGEPNEKIIKTLNWIGGKAEEKLYKRLNELTGHYNVEKYKNLSY